MNPLLIASLLMLAVAGCSINTRFGLQPAPGQPAATASPPAPMANGNPPGQQQENQAPDAPEYTETEASRHLRELGIAALRVATVALFLLIYVPWWAYR